MFDTFSVKISIAAAIMDLNTFSNKAKYMILNIHSGGPFQAALTPTQGKAISNVF